MPRSKHTKISRPSEIVPVARPVDTYVRPATPARSSLHDVAKGIGAFDRGLNAFLKKRQGEQDKADKIRGEAAFHKANQTGWAEAVKSGEVPANSSPIFMEAYKRQQGNLLGTRMRDNFNAAYQKWEGRNSDDPEVFNEFLSGFIGEHVTTEDPDILAGLNPHLQALTQNGFTAHSKQRAATIYKENLDNHGAGQSELIDEASGEGLETGTGTDYETLWGVMVEQRMSATSTGTVESDYDDMMVESIIAKAIEHGDPQLLEFLDREIPGEDHALSSYPKYRDAKMQALDKMERMAVASQTRKDKLQEDADKKELDSYVRGSVNGLIENPHTEVDDAMMKRWSALDPEGPIRFMRIRKEILAGNSLEDPEEMLKVFQGIRIGHYDAEDINQLVLSGVIRTPQGFKSAYTELDRMAKSNRDGTGILKDDTAKIYLKTLKTRTETADLDVLGTKGLTDAGLAATNHFSGLLLDWEERNPEASKIERVEAIIRIGDAVMKNIAGEDEDGNPAYNRQVPITTGDQPEAEQEAQLPEVAEAQQEGSVHRGAPIASPQRSNEAEIPIRLHPISGRPLLNNGDGTYSSEESITVTHPSINNGEPTNIPSIWGGRRFDDEEEIVQRAIASGQHFKAFGSIPEAVAAARQRSEQLGEALSAQKRSPQQEAAEAVERILKEREETAKQ